MVTMILQFYYLLIDHRSISLVLQARLGLQDIVFFLAVVSFRLQV